MKTLQDEFLNLWVRAGWLGECGDRRSRHLDDFVGHVGECHEVHRVGGGGENHPDVGWEALEKQEGGVGLRNLICLTSQRCSELLSRQASEKFVGSLGCSKGLKTLNIIVRQQSDYGGYDRINWELQTNENHIEYAERNRSAKTKTSRVANEHDTCVRYSIVALLRLCEIQIDPMHNLLLGTVKHVMNLWIKRGIFATSHFD